MSEYLQLCHKVPHGSPKSFAGWYMSEKLDGMRVWWDGGVTRGLPKHHVPYANLVKGIGPTVCTGLWSRLGNIVPAPDWWLDTLPTGVYLDGELYAGYEHRQKLLSWVKSDWITPKGSSPWRNIRICAYDVVPGPLMNMARRVRAGLYKWDVRQGSLGANISPGTPYRERHQMLRDELINCPYADAHQQTVIIDRAHLGAEMANVLARGGEGLVIRDPYAMYVMERSKTCLKLKDYSDTEMVIVGHSGGLGRNAGRLGSYTCSFGGVYVSVSGMTDDERERPLPIGTVITVRYRGLSVDGVPLEARSMGPRIDV